MAAPAPDSAIGDHVWLVSANSGVSSKVTAIIRVLTGKVDSSCTRLELGVPEDIVLAFDVVATD